MSYSEPATVAQIEESIMSRRQAWKAFRIGVIASGRRFPTSGQEAQDVHDAATTSTHGGRMSLADAKRALQWTVVAQALKDAEVDAETQRQIEHAWNVDTIFHSMAAALLGTADVKQAKNYIKVEVVGLSLPFERLYIEATRPNGKTSHEWRELLREKLLEARHYVDGSHGRGMPDMETFAAEISALLALESP